MIEKIIITLLQLSTLILIMYIVLATSYLIFLAVTKVFVKGPILNTPNKYNKFCLLIPAHNEEMVIERLCQSIMNINYPKEFYTVNVIADNCSDGTIKICRKHVDGVLVRNEMEKQGKGYAIDYGLRNIDLEKFDSVLIIDADNVVEKNILNELNKFLYNGSEVIQCYNGIRNREDSWFTEILYVSRTIVNVLYHDAKYKLGFSAYLMGNGMCFSTKLLKIISWNAFSIGEDWEFYANLIEMNKKVDFAINAKVFHQESKTLNQATSQRLRWSKGRFEVLKNTGIKLFTSGIKTMNIIKMDGALPLIFPNYSLLVNLNLITVILNYFIFKGNIKNTINFVLFTTLLAQFCLFSVGIYISGKWLRTLTALCSVPFFLIWKMIIDILSVTGIYKGKKWKRTSRM